MKKLLLLGGAALAGALVFQLTRQHIPTLEDRYVEVMPYRLYYRLHNHVFYFRLAKTFPPAHLQYMTLRWFRTGRVVDSWYELRKVLPAATTELLNSQLRNAFPKYW